MVDENMNNKHEKKFFGPFRVEKLKTNLALLRHFNTQKLWKSYVHVSKLKKDKSLARNRVIRKYQQHGDKSVPDAVEKNSTAAAAALPSTDIAEPPPQSSATASIELPETTPIESNNLSSDEQLNSDQVHHKQWLRQVIESSRKLYAIIN